MRSAIEIDPEPVPSAALAEYVETDRSGYKSFAYAANSGSLFAVVDCARMKLAEIQHLRGKARNAAMKDLKQFLDNHHARKHELQREWNEFYPRHHEWRVRQIHKARETERGGPTVTDLERPYCKPDQSCCDFACGN